MDAQPESATELDRTERHAAEPWQQGQDGRYYSPDGRYWWDGWTWQSLPRGPIGRWATAHRATYPIVVALIAGVGFGTIRLSMNLMFSGAIPSAIVLAYSAIVPGLIGWFTASGQLKRWGAR